MTQHTLIRSDQISDDLATFDAAPQPSAAPITAWGAVGSMALTVSVLIASEFMPVSLLTPIARDLSMLEGQAGQVISISGFFAVVTSLFIARLAAGLDRKTVLTWFSVVLVFSALVVTFAPTYWILMAGRALLGIAIGGFWSMSTAIVMRLLPSDQVPKGLAALNAGNAIAATISAPLGSFLGELIGWRGAFFLVVPLALVALAWQWLTMPDLPAKKEKPTANVFHLLARRQVALGMTAILLLFMGQFALFTYLRPYMESVSGFDVTLLSLVMLLMGLCGIAGTWAISRLLPQWLYALAIGMPITMALLAAGLVFASSSQLAVTLLLGAWGFVGTAAPVAWGTWLSQVLSDDAEAGGGLQVAVIQFAITLGAALGGLLFDHVGWWSSYLFAGLLLVGSSLAAWAARSNRENAK
ncbi:MAG: MFS transporter [Rhizobium sp.]|nr:MFS transporter [Rhizobium sp.]